MPPQKKDDHDPAEARKGRPASTKNSPPALRRVTVFGGTGFIGRALVRELRAQNCNVIAAERHPDSLSPTALEPQGNGGPLTRVKADVTCLDTVQAAIDESDGVINLVGILYEKGAQTFAGIHEEGARNVALAARAAKATRLLHMSALGASPTSPSLYARTKAAGERAVRDVFPEATIFRPSIVFGPEDDFFNKFARMARFSPGLPLIGGGTTRFQPIYVGDVVKAFVAALSAPAQQGKTFELGGPRTLTFKELMALLLEQMGTRRLLVPIPFPLASLQAAFMEALPTPPLTRDQVALLQTDNVTSGEYPGLAELGIEATPLDAILPSYIR